MSFVYEAVRIKAASDKQVSGAGRERKWYGCRICLVFESAVLVAVLPKPWWANTRDGNPGELNLYKIGVCGTRLQEHSFWSGTEC